MGRCPFHARRQRLARGLQRVKGLKKEREQRGREGGQAGRCPFHARRRRPERGAGRKVLSANAFSILV